MRLDETIVLDFSLRIGADEVQAHGIEFYVYDPIETADDGLAPLILGQPTLRDLGFGLVKLPSSKRVHFAAPLQVRDDIIRECFNESRLPTDEELRFLREQTIEDQRTIADKGFQDMIAHLRAQTDILTHEQIEKLVDQANRYRDIFRYGLPEQACTISALAERLNTSHVPPTRPRFLNLSPEREYKTWSHLIILLSMGVLSVYKTGTVPYACPSLVIGEKARLVTDTSKQKDLLEKMPQELQDAEELIKKITGKGKDGKSLGWWFATDIPSAFFIVSHVGDTPANARLTHCRNFSFTYERMIMGGLNSMAQLVRVLDIAFADVAHHAHYADDLRTAATSAEELLELNEIFFAACRKYQIPINPAKTSLCDNKTYWVGYHIDAHGHRPDPRSATVVQAMERPSNAYDLARAIGIARWMSTAIFDLAQLIRPLDRVVGDARTAVGSSKASELKKYKLTEGMWTAELDNCWKSLKAAMVTTIKRSHRDRSKALVLLTDASNTGWAGILCQVPRKYVRARPIRPSTWGEGVQILACLGGNFTPTQQNYPTVEGEMYAVKRSLERMWHEIHDGSVLTILTDNAALKDILDPKSDYIARKDGPGRGRLLRWVTDINENTNDVHHIPAEENLLADFVSRFREIPPEDDLIPDEDADPSYACLINHVEFDAKRALLNPAHPNWEQPSIQEIRDFAGDEGKDDLEFLRLAESLGCVFDSADRVWRLPRGQVLIPKTPNLVREKLLIMAHCSSAGHRGVESTLANLKDLVFWPEMDADTKLFCTQGCTHCQVNRSKHQHRLYGRPFSATQPREVLSMDFLHLGENAGGTKMLLVLTDKYSNFTLMHTAKSEGAEEVAPHVIEWISAFGFPQYLMSDHGPGFDNAVIQRIRESFKIDHHLVTAGIHWSHGKQERLNEVLNKAFRKLLSENRMDWADWDLLVPQVQFHINHTRVASLGNHAPIEIFTAQAPSSPIDAFLDRHLRPRAGKFSSLDEFVSQIAEEHKARLVAVRDIQEQDFLARQARQAKRRGVEAFHPSIGDYVMIRNDSTASKLAPNWIGPAKVTAVVQPGLTYKVKFLVNPKGLRRDEVYHTSHMQFFSYADTVLSRDLREQAKYFSSEELKVLHLRDYRVKKGVGQVLVEWERGPQTWEDAVSLHESIPELFEDLMEKDGPTWTNKGQLKKLRTLLNM